MMRRKTGGLRCTRGWKNLEEKGITIEERNEEELIHRKNRVNKTA